MTRDLIKYEFIDALRGYAILGVVLVHSAQHVAPENSTLSLLMSNGGRGVQLFFIVSALTLCMSWFSRSVHENMPIRNFFIRRFFRIAPLFYIAMVFYIILYGLMPRYWAPNDIEWWHILLTVFFLNGFHSETIHSIVPGGWSIAVEMNFYLMLPLVLTRCRSVNSLLMFFLFTLTLYVVTKFVFNPALQDNSTKVHGSAVLIFTSLNIIGQLPVFAIGILAYFVLINKRLLRSFVIAGNLVLSLVILLLLAFPVSSFGSRVFSHHIVVSLALAMFALTLAYCPFRLLVNGVVRMIGKLSFSMYVSHFAVLELFSRTNISSVFVRGDVASIIHFLLVVAATAAVSYCLYRSIERPGIMFGEHLLYRLDSRADSVH